MYINRFKWNCKIRDISIILRHVNILLFDTSLFFLKISLHILFSKRTFVNAIIDRADFCQVGRLATSQGEKMKWIIQSIDSSA